MAFGHFGGGKKRNILWFFRNLLKNVFWPKMRWFIFLPIMIGVTSLFFDLSISDSIGAQNGKKRSRGDEVFIDQIAPDMRGGKAYKLVYLVKSLIDFYWKFKTDFDNDFLVKNKYIREHNFISQNGNTVITEEKYTSGPDFIIRWPPAAIF
jgi:hypothetical protein